MNIVSIEKVSKSYTERMLLHEISFGIEEGDRIGVIGINGTGKSTLLKVIAGVEKPNSGQITAARGLAIEYLSQNPSFDNGATVIEQIFNDKFKHDVAEFEAKTILTKLGLSDFDANVGTLSGGGRKRIALAGCLIRPSDLLILDEPTNQLDSDTIDWLEKHLNSRKGALLMVTHDRYFLERVCNKIIELDGGNLYSYQANYSKYLEMKAEREESEQASERKRKSLYRMELEWVKRGARARSTKQKARLDRFDELKETKLVEKNENIDIKVGATRLGKKTIELDHVCKSYQGKKVIDDFSYIVDRNDRLGILGPNGIGKTTLLKIFSGRLKPDSGTVDTGETVKIGFFTQEAEEMDGSLRVIDYIREQAHYINTSEGQISAADMLEKFLFTPSMQWTPISKLSGGEKRRLYLLHVLMGAPNVLLLDEPTNDLDIQTLSILENYLDGFPGAVIVVSHDRYFIDRVVDKRFILSPTVVESKSDTTKPKAEKGNTEGKKDRPLKFTYKEQKEFDEIDGIIAGLEERLRKLNDELAAAASDYVLLQKLLPEKETLEAELSEAMERWVYLNELAERIAKGKNI